MTQIFIEARYEKTSEYVFLNTIIKELGFSEEQYKIICVGGNSNLVKAANKFKENTIEGGKNLIIFDADTPATGYGFSATLQRINQELQSNGMQADGIFLFPNNTDDGVIIRTMVLSGAICGLMGLLLVGGIHHTLTTTVVDGRGFTAVMVSWLAKFNPIAMIFTSLLLVVLSRGAGEISSAFGLNHSFADILTGIILFFIIGSEFFITYQISVRKSAGKEA